MNMVRIAILGAVLLALAVPADLAAQGRGQGKAKGKKDKHEKHEKFEQRSDQGPQNRARDRSEVRVEVDDDRVVVRRRGRVVVRDRDRDIVIRDRDIDRRFRVQNRRGSPAFCRSGAGHPVHGRRWCLEKGFGLGDRGDVFFEDDDGIIFWDGDEVVLVRDRRLDRDRSVWDRVLDTVLFWRD